jgi:transketolase
MEVEMITREFCLSKNPGYMRINKNGESALHPGVPAFNSGRPHVLAQGKEKLILATGAMVQEAAKWAIETGFELWSFPVISPLRTEWINSDLLKFKEIITVEEHQLNSGFGSAVLEVINDAFYKGTISSFPKIRRIGIPNEFIAHSGSQEYLRKEAKLFL